MIYTFSPFGYEGSLVSVETDFRRGIPAYDIIGLADSAVKESRERIRFAFANSGLEFPPERVLQALSPADLRKECPMDLAMALSIIATQQNLTENVLVLGELELSGKLHAVRGVHAAVSTAISAGITKVICPIQNKFEALGVSGSEVIGVESLNDAIIALKDGIYEKAKEQVRSMEVVFDEERIDEIDFSPFKGLKKQQFAMAVAIAGKHNIMFEGVPGCGKTLLMQHMQSLVPEISFDEALTTSRIWSLAGLMRPNEELVYKSPFRMPHQTASIEGICGGGPNCRPGEISLAHNGVLFLDEASEFRTSVLQMLRVPLECHSIILSRAGRSTVYPADFQLWLATNPCPCGNYGSKDRICLCSAKSIEMYWRKFSAPLLDRIEIVSKCERQGDDMYSVEELKKMIKTAYEIQRKKGTFNSKLVPTQMTEIQISSEAKSILDEKVERYGFSPRRTANFIKTALTVANIDGREQITDDDMKTAIDLFNPVFEF